MTIGPRSCVFLFSKLDLPKWWVFLWFPLEQPSNSSVWLAFIHGSEKDTAHFVGALIWICGQLRFIKRNTGFFVPCFVFVLCVTFFKGGCIKWKLCLVV